MTLDLKVLFSGKEKELPFAFSLDLSDVESAGERPFQKPVEVEGKIESIADTVCLTARAKASYSAACHRCGEDCQREYIVKISYVLVAELAGEEQDHIIEVPDMEIDLAELCREEVILGMPTKHLCADSCKGLCETCGKNLNEGDCSCQKGTIDSRLEILKNLLD